MAISLAAAALGSAVIGGAATAYGASQQKKAANKALAANERASQQQLAAQQANFDRITGMNQPFVQGGSAAFNQLLSEFGITPGGSAASSAPRTSLSYDAAGNVIAPPPGSPAGKTPGGSAGTSPLEQPAAQPTPAAPAAPPSPDWNAYLQANPDVSAEFQRLSSTPEGRAHLQSIGATTPEAFSGYHYQTYGQDEGRTLPTAAPAAQPAPPAPDPNAPPDLMNASRPTASVAPTFTRPNEIGAPNTASYFSNFEADPGAEYRRSEALNGVNAFSAVRGKLRSGDAAKSLATLSSNLASQEYNNWFNRQMSKANLDVGLWRDQQGRQDRNFGDDRAYGTSMWQFGTDRGDRNFNTDRQYQTGRQDTRTGNLFNLTNVGLTGAGNVAGAGTNFANAQSNIFGSQANAAADAAYARANANTGMVGGIAGAATNLFANWGGGSGGGSDPNRTGSNGRPLWSGGTY